MRLFGADMFLPGNFAMLPAEQYFERRWVLDISPSFRMNTVEVAHIPAPAYSGIAVVEGVASPDACTLAPEDNALVSLLAIGNNLRGGVNWSRLANATLLMSVLNMRGAVPGRIAAGNLEVNGLVSGLCRTHSLLEFGVDGFYAWYTW